MKKKSLLPLLCIFLLSGFAHSQELYMYVSDAGGFNTAPWQILRYNADGSNPQIFIDNSFFVEEGVGWPQDIVFLEGDNTVLISCLVGGRITKHNADTGAYIDDFATVSGGPTRMKIGPDNTLYVLQWSNTVNEVLRFDLDGSPLGAFTDTGIAQSIGMDWDSTGDFYVSSYGGRTVTRFDSNGQFIETYVDTELSGPTNIWFDENDHLYVVDWSGGNVEHFDENGDHVGVWSSGLPQGEGVDFLPNTNVLIGVGGGARVDQFTTDGTFVETTVPQGSGGLQQPNAVVLREATLGIEESFLSKLKIAPTLGSTFHIDNQQEILKTVEVFNGNGKLIAKLPTTNEIIWNATHIKEGVYFMVFTSNEGIQGTQKLIVKH